MKKHFTLCVFTVLSYYTVHADHIMGGAMSYRYTGSSDQVATFQLTFQMIRDADGLGAAFDNPAEIGIWTKNPAGEINYYSTLNVNHGPIETLEFSEFYPFGNVVTAQVTRYIFNVDLPKNGLNYIIGYTRCCRVNDLRNVLELNSVAPYQPGATYSIEITAEAMALGNSSPRPQMFAMDFLIHQGDFERQFVFTDSDGDEIVYDLIAPLTGAGIAGGSGPGSGNERGCDGIRPDPAECFPPFMVLDYQPGYTAQKPFGEQTNVVMDPETGRLHGSVEVPGLYVVGVIAREFRSGKLLGEVVMDYTFRISAIPPNGGVNGYRYFDANKNSLRDSAELAVPNILLNFTPQVIDLRFAADGRYAMWADTGFYEITSPDPRFTISTNPPFVVHLDSVAGQTHVDVPFVALEEFTDLDLYLLPPRYRCNELATFKLNICNIGTTVQSGEILLIIDSLLEIMEIDPAMEEINNYQFVVRYDSLFPFQKSEVQFKVRMPDESFIGDTMDVSAMAVYYDVVDPMNTDTLVYTIKGELTCAIDPNDKLTHPVRGAKNFTFIDEYITYTVRFENIGNDTAYNVRILDALESALDLKTLRIIDASHPYEVEWIGNSLNVLFDNVNLTPTSTNSEASQGYFVFKVKPAKWVNPGHVISNNAKIYFDSNSPITTNTVSNEITNQRLDVVESFHDVVLFSIFPNPSNESFSIRYPSYDVPHSSIRVFTLAGIQMDHLEINGFAHEFGHEYPPGIYFYEIKSNTNSSIQHGKLIKVQE